MKTDRGRCGRHRFAHCACTWTTAPTLRPARAASTAASTSVMIDGSHLSFEENIALTKKVVEYAHDRGVTVEAELGRLAGVEDDVNVSAEDASYTQPDEVEEFVDPHRRVTPWPLPSAPATALTSSSPARSRKLRFDILEEVGRAPARLPDRSARRFLRSAGICRRSSTSTAARCPTPSAFPRTCSARRLPWPFAKSTSTPTCVWP